MLAFPNCKINLGLNITRKREDGYHDIETVFYPILLKDIVEIVKDPTLKGTVHFTTTGLTIEGDPSNNLCVKAYNLLLKDFPQLSSVNMHLHKVIPMGAGLGGGSADGACALQLLNNSFHLQLSTQQLIDYALQLGSDCPFFVLNKPCFATGRGEKMELIELDLSNYHFVLVNPQIHISTGWAFSSIQPTVPEVSIKTIIQDPIDTWKNRLVNDFEKAAINNYPIIGAIKEELVAKGAVYSSMTGSGSTVFGIFEKHIDATFTFPKEWVIYKQREVN